MGNNDFSYFSCLGRSTSSAPNSGGTQPEQDIEQDQQVTFSGRSMISTRLPESETFLICHEQLIHNEQTTFTDLEISPPPITDSPTDDPDKLFLASMHESRAVNPRASTNANVTSSTITSSTAEHSPETDDLENPRLAAFIADQPAIQSSGRFGSAITNPPEDPFAALASYESTSSFEDPSSFEEPIRSEGNDRLRLYNSGFGIFDDFRDTFPEEEEAELIISPPSKQATPAATGGSPTPDSSSQGQLEAKTEAALKTATEKTTEQTGHVSGSFLEDLLGELLVEPQEEPQQTQQASHQVDPPAKASACSQEHASVPISSVNVMGNTDIPLIQMPPVVKAQIYPPLPQSVLVRIQPQPQPQPLPLQAVRVWVPQLQPQLQQTVRVQIPQLQPQFQQTVRVQIPQPQSQLQQTVRVQIPQPQPQLQQTVRVQIPQPQSQLQQTVRVHIPRPQPQLQQTLRVQVPLPQLQQLLRPQPRQMEAYSGDSEVAPHSPPIIPKLGRPRKRMKRLTDKWIIRTDLKGRPFKCGYHGCGRTYKSSGHLQAHFFEHTRISDHRCTYPACGPKRYFRGSSDLQRHINKHHANIIPWSFAYCRQEFESSESLKNHVQSQHPVNPK